MGPHGHSRGRQSASALEGGTHRGCPPATMLSNELRHLARRVQRGKVTGCAYGDPMTLARERSSTSAELDRRLAHLWGQRGLPQAQLAGALDIGRRYVPELEAGKPSLYSGWLFRLLELLDAGFVVEQETVL